MWRKDVGELEERLVPRSRPRREHLVQRLRKIGGRALRAQHLELGGYAQPLEILFEHGAAKRVDGAYARAAEIVNARAEIIRRFALGKASRLEQSRMQPLLYLGGGSLVEHEHEYAPDGHSVHDLGDYASYHRAGLTRAGSRLDKHLARRFHRVPLGVGERLEHLAFVALSSRIAGFFVHISAFNLDFRHIRHSSPSSPPPRTASARTFAMFSSVSELICILRSGGRLPPFLE